MGSFPILVVSLTRETTKLWLLTLVIIAFRFLMRRVFIRAFGSSGGGDGQLNQPYAVVVDLQGNCFVAESDNHRVSVFDSKGQFLRKFGSKGNGNGQLFSPRGIDLMSNGNVVVGEYSISRVSIFDSQGNFVRHVGASQLANPYHLFIDSDGNILVADNTFANPIRVFKSDGTLVKNISIAGSGGTVGICMDPEGRIIAGVRMVDSENTLTQWFGGEACVKKKNVHTPRENFQTPTLGVRVCEKRSLCVCDFPIGY